MPVNTCLQSIEVNGHSVGDKIIYTLFTVMRKPRRPGYVGYPIFAKLHFTDEGNRSL